MGVAYCICLKLAVLDASCMQVYLNGMHQLCNLLLREDGRVKTVLTNWDAQTQWEAFQMIALDGV